jgi:hypothetical protein
LIKRRISFALRAGGGWDDISEAFGLDAGDVRRRYPRWDRPDQNWGWGYERSG